MGRLDMLKRIKTTLESQVCSELSDLKKIDTKELGEVIDMIKDLGQTMYYCSVVKAMEDKEEEAEWSPRYYDDEEHKHHHMNYNHHSSMMNIDDYIEDLDTDLTDMIKESTQEEKQLLSTKLQHIANKINTK